MDRTINAKQLRASLPETVRRVRRGERFTVLYRSRPAFRIVRVDEAPDGSLPPLAEDPQVNAPVVVMKERRIRAALTSDRHFVQAGVQTFP